MVLCLTAKDNNKESGDREHPEELTTKFWSLRPYRRHSSPVNQSNKFSAFYCFFSPSYKTMTSLSLFAKFWQPGHRQLLSGHQPFTLSSLFNRVVYSSDSTVTAGSRGPPEDFRPGYCSTLCCQGTPWQRRIAGEAQGSPGVPAA